MKTLNLKTGEPIEMPTIDISAKTEKEMIESVVESIESIELNLRRIKDMLKMRGNYADKPIQWQKICRRLFSVGSFANGNACGIADRIMELVFESNGGE